MYVSKIIMIVRGISCKGVHYAGSSVCFLINLAESRTEFLWQDTFSSSEACSVLLGVVFWHNLGRLLCCIREEITDARGSIALSFVDRLGCQIVKV